MHDMSKQQNNEIGQNTGLDFPQEILAVQNPQLAAPMF